VTLHTDAVAKDGAAREGARGVDGQDADASPLFAEGLDEPVAERRFARAGVSGHADDACAARLRKEVAEEILVPRAAVVDKAKAAREGRRVSGQDAFGEGVHDRARL